MCSSDLLTKVCIWSLSLYTHGIVNTELDRSHTQHKAQTSQKHKHHSLLQIGVGFNGELCTFSLNLLLSLFPTPSSSSPCHLQIPISQITHHHLPTFLLPLQTILHLQLHKPNNQPHSKIANQIPITHTLRMEKRIKNFNGKK